MNLNLMTYNVKIFNDFNAIYVRNYVMQCKLIIDISMI